MKPFIIGIAGGSGSGKSTVTQHIVATIGDQKVAIIKQDFYYNDLAHLSLPDRQKINFDHPDAFDWKLLNEHLLGLYNGQSIQMPQHNFASYIREKDSITVTSAPVVIVEGIFALMDKSLCDLMSLKIYVDTAPDICFIRRLQRDLISRGRTVENVIEQYLGFVRPMYKKFIEPTKRNSHIIIPHGANKAALEMIVARINAVLNNQQIASYADFKEEQL